jgi:hypothetical protein
MSNTKNSMSSGPKSSQWVTDNGQYTRPFDAFEKFFSSLCHDPARPEFRSLDAAGVVDLKILLEDENIFLETLKKAWMRIRYLHPFLACEVSGQTFRYTPLKGQSDLDDWLKKTFIIKDWDDGSELQKHQDLTIEPGTKVPSLYYFRGKQRLFFRINHMLLDAYGAVAMIQDLFSEIHRLQSGGQIVNEPWGEEVRRLASGELDAAGIAVPKDPWFSNMPQLRTDGQAFEIPSINNALPPGSCKTQYLKFSENQTSELLSRSKELGIGINPFIHTALIHAGKSVSPSSCGTVHSDFIIAKIREKCTTSPQNAHVRATALRIIFWPIQVHVSDSFQRTARGVKNEYQSLAGQKHAAIAKSIPYSQKAISVLEKSIFRGILPSFFGNLSDIFPKTYGYFKVQDLWMVAAPTDERIYLGVHTFGSKLSIRACYNQTYHTDEQIANYLMQIKQEIYTGMGSKLGRLNFLSMMSLGNLFRILRGWYSWLVSGQAEKRSDEVVPSSS